MSAPAPAAIAAQLAAARAVIERHLGSGLRALHLYGSALDGGLKPHSDIDLLATVDAPLDEAVRQALMLDLLAVSRPPGASPGLRALEVTVLVHGEVLPWRYPARRALQFGEWLRDDLVAGVFEPPMEDIDLAILLTKARQHGIALAGPAARDLFDPVPRADFMRALGDTVGQWQAPADWEGDERNVVLALARIWYSATTGAIAAKDAAAEWAMARLSAEHRATVDEARLAYLGRAEDHLAGRAAQTAATILHMKAAIVRLLQAGDAGPAP